MIKLIASDIDGTLVKEGANQLNAEYYEVILKLKEKGIVFTAASGRPYPSIARLFEPIKDDMIFVAENGAYVMCRGQEMSRSVIAGEIVRELIQDVRRIKDCEICLSGDKGVYVESKDSQYLHLLIHEYKNTVIQVDDLLNLKDDFIKLSIYHRENAVKAASEIIMPKWGEQLEVVCAGELWLDCMNFNVNKGEAIKRIQNQLNISKEETMAFGDNLNDIAMLKQAGESYAIGNAREEVKRTAKYIADISENDGVLKILKSLLK